MKINVLDTIKNIDLEKYEKHRLSADIEKGTNEQLEEIAKYYNLSKSEIVRIVLSTFSEYTIEKFKKPRTKEKE